MSKEYSPIEPNNSHEEESQAEDYESLLTERQNRRKTSRQSWVLAALLVPVACFSLVGFGFWIGSRWSADLDRICSPHVQRYSPVLKETDVSLHTVTFNGSLLKENAFRQNAGPEVDAAWASLGVGYRSLALPESEAAASGFKPDQVKINPKYGGGYPANVEGLHHLHCLNLVRQALYYNYDYYHEKKTGAFVNDDNIVRHHVSHCLDIVRQQLMCQPDTGLLGQVWWNQDAPTAFVDFNTEHKCKNFDAIRKWAEERQMPQNVPKDFLQPPKEGDRVYASIP